MDRKAYIDRVIAALRRTTWEEQEAIRAELEGHIQDHMEGLLDLGYDEALAEERTLAAMGDPTEIGRELDREYPLRWLIAGRLAKALAILLVLPMVLSLMLSETGLLSCIQARLDPGSRVSASALADGAVICEVDLRQTVGNDVLRIYQVAVGEWQTDSGTETAAEIRAVAYDRVPFGLVAGWQFGEMTLVDQRGQNTGFCGTNFLRDDRVCYVSGWVEISPEDTAVTLTGDRFGRNFSVEIPLPEVTP